ncbi:hypothetical protein [Sphingomonas glacialis]|uniref:hypothetical protein n=1 Tax=Sphingomonas glacialis TaxID=658225 RepID=UPI00112EBC5E|nr:hypothetical protein [Sphingomonas glacialis]
MADLIDVRVRYRLAKFVTATDPDLAVPDAATLESMVRGLLAGQLGNDVNERVIPTVEDVRHSICLHFSQLNEGALAFDLLHLDDRKVVPTWKRPTKPVPVSTLGGTAIAKDEVNLNEPAYLMISGNHVAVIERVGLRTPTIENYLNDILSKASTFDKENQYWKLVPIVEAIGVSALKGGVEKIVLKPHAALIGEAISQVSHDHKPRRYTRKIDEFIGYGQRIIDMLEIFGAKEGDIENLRKKMSSDLVLKARVEISVSRAERSSEAKVSADDIQKAFASITDGADINVIDKDGNTNGKITQLYHRVEVAHENGIIDMKHAVNALSAAMAAWAAKGVIELQ